MIDQAYYDENARKAKAFDNWIASRIRAGGWPVVVYDTKQDQLAHGDLCIDGLNVEVKLDLKFAQFDYDTAFIETDELARNGTFVRSGIQSRSDFKYLLYGDYKVRIVMPRVLLMEDFRRAALDGKLRPATHKGQVTGHGFVMRVSRCRELERRCEEWVRASSPCW